MCNHSKHTIKYKRNGRNLFSLYDSREQIHVGCFPHFNIISYEYVYYVVSYFDFEHNYACIRCYLFVNFRKTVC